MIIIAHATVYDSIDKIKIQRTKNTVSKAHSIKFTEPNNFAYNFFFFF